jgi:hypothetical protein
MLVDADKSVDVISKKNANTSRPNTFVIALGETPPLPGTRVMCWMVLINLSITF